MFNQPLSFDTSSVTTMAYMFSGASVFNQPLSFDTSNVTEIYYMFHNAKAFNQPLSFDTSSVKYMGYMFFVRSSPCPAPICRRALPRTLLAPPSPAASRIRPGRSSPRTPYALRSTLGRACRRSTSR